MTSAPPVRVDELKRLMQHHDGPVDACIVGCGAGGSVLVKELAEGGMSVVVIEAGDGSTRARTWSTTSSR